MRVLGGGGDPPEEGGQVLVPQAAGAVGQSPLSDQVAVESREETLVDFPHNTGSRWWLLAIDGCYVGGGSG